MRASRSHLSIPLTQSYRLIPTDIFSLLQCIAEICYRLIRPPPSCPWLRSLSHYLRAAYSFASVTSPENHTRFTSHPLLYPTRSLLISPVDLPSERSYSVCISLSQYLTSLISVLSSPLVWYARVRRDLHFASRFGTFDKALPQDSQL